MNGLPRRALRSCERARDQLLAGAALAGDQHRRVALGDGLDAVASSRSIGGLRPMMARRRRALALRCDSSARACSSSRLRARWLGDALHLQDELVDVERLGQVVVRAFLQRGDRVGDGGVAR